MLTRNSTSHGLSILLLGVLILTGFDSVYAASSTSAKPNGATEAQPILAFTNTSNLNVSSGYGTTMRDIVLVIDTTSIMAYETSGNPNFSDPGADDPALCNLSHTCQPMESIKSAAIDFIDLLYFPYDRVGIVAMTSQYPAGPRTPMVVLPITSNELDVRAALEDLRVFQPPSCDSLYGVCRSLCTADEISYANSSGDYADPCYQKTEGYYLGLECPILRSSGDPSSCTSTDVGTSLELAGSKLSDGESRPNAQHIVITLVGGPASASIDVSGTFPFGFCPSSTWNSPTSPFCRDASSLSRHSLPDLNYDADDYARDKADFMASAGAKVFTIGLGNQIQHASKGDPAAGEKLLQYIALTAGGDNANHGSYFYAPNVPALPAIFQAIVNNTDCSSAIVVANNHDNGAGSLRQAITDVCSGGTVTFDPSLSGGTIPLASPLIVDKSVTIDGSSIASHIQISGDTDNNGTGDVAVFQITGSSVVEFNGLDIVKGKASGTSGGGGIANYGTLTVKNSTLSGNSYTGGIGGGGIYNKGTLTIFDSTITGNIAEDGGGIFNEYGRTLTITGSTFSNNSAQSASTLRGGGGGIANIGTLSVDDSIFLENIAYSGGGAIVNSIDGTSAVTNSSFTGNSSFGNGVGGAINNYEGSMTIESCIFTGNSDFGPKSNGGAVYNEDQMNITDSTFATNSGAYGGAIANVGTITIADSTLSHNSADSGGGIVNIGELTITHSSIMGNSIVPISGFGGGIANNAGGILTITDSTISDHSAPYGGGIFNFGEATITNSTISGNSASENGGGVFNLGTFTGRNNTLSDNSALTSGGGMYSSGTLNLANTIIANSTNGADCVNDGGTIGMNTNNLVKNNAASPNQCGNPLLTSDPKLGPLADNGGSTLTMSLLPGSPAIDAGDDTVCAAVPVNNTSQNGVTRPVGTHCDIGSFEAPDTTPPTILSITRAGSNPAGSASVNFLVTFSESVTGVDNSDFFLNTNNIVGAAVSSVSGTGFTRIVKVNSGSGDGTIRLDAVDDNTILDLASNPLNGGFTTGETYTIDKPNLSAPTLRSPRNNVFIHDTTPTFWWTAVRGAATYEIEVASDNTFATIMDTAVVNGLLHTVPVSLSDGGYYWRVRAYNASNQPGVWGSPRTFTVDTTGPSAPIPSSPINNFSSNRTLIFKWLSVPGAVLYQFQYDNDSDFSSPTYTVTVRGTFRRPPAMKAGTYYWQVRAKDASGNWGNWSAPFVITITNP